MTAPVRLFVDPKGSIIQSLRTEIEGDAVYLSRDAVLAILRRWLPEFGTRECSCDGYFEAVIEDIEEAK